MLSRSWFVAILPYLPPKRAIFRFDKVRAHHGGEGFLRQVREEKQQHDQKLSGNQL